MNFSQEMACLRQVLTDTGVYNFDGQAGGETVPGRKKSINEKIVFNTLELKEEDDGASLNELRVVNVCAGALALKPDHCCVQMFKPGRWNKACDYLLFVEVGGVKHALFIELKSAIPRRSVGGVLRYTCEDARKYGMQLLGADALLDYFTNVVSRQNPLEFPRRNFMEDYKRHYVILYNHLKDEGDGKMNSFALSSTGGKPSKWAFMEGFRVGTKQVVNGETIRVEDLIA